MTHIQVEDDMSQCSVCEDWFHSRVSCGIVPGVKLNISPQHLGCPPPDDDLYDEMVCDSCASRLPFLEPYAIHTRPSAVAPEKEDICVEVMSEGKETGKDEEEKCLFARWKTVQGASQRPVLKTLYFSEGWRKRICRCQSCLVGPNMHSDMFIQ